MPHLRDFPQCSREFTRTRQTDGEHEASIHGCHHHGDKNIHWKQELLDLTGPVSEPVKKLICLLDDASVSAVTSHLLVTNINPALLQLEVSPGDLWTDQRNLFTGTSICIGAGLSWF